MPDKMTDRRLVLVSVAVLLDAPLEDEAMHNRLDTLADDLRAVAGAFAERQPDCTQMNAVAFHYLTGFDENATRCSRCGCWMSDVNKPDCIDCIGLGWDVNGAMVCTQCQIDLPDIRPLA